MAEKRIPKSKPVATTQTGKKDRFPLVLRIVQVFLVLDAVFSFLAAATLFTTYSPVFGLTQLLIVAALLVSVWGMNQRRLWSFRLAVVIVVFAVISEVIPAVNWPALLIDAILLILLFEGRSFFEKAKPA